MGVALLSAYSLPSATNNYNLKGCLENFIEAKLFSRPQLSTGFSRETSKNSRYRKPLYVSLAVKCGQSTIKKVDKENGVAPIKGAGRLILSEGRDGHENNRPICPGCGIFMQDKDPNLPGFYKERKVEVSDGIDKEEDLVFDEEGEVEDEEGSDGIEGGFQNEDGIDWDLEEWESDLEKEDDELKELDGFGPAGIGYGNVTEETIDKGKKKKLSKSERKRLAREAQKEKEEVTVCARCHSLRNYGQVKNQVAENLIPDFDFDRLITTRLMKPTGIADATVVVMVVDCVDFDGSFPKRAAKSLFNALEGNNGGSKLKKKLPKLVLVATKVDLLPSQVSPARLDRWVRHRAKANGAPKLSGVYLVSAHKDLGVKNLLAFIKELAGPRGNVWVIGAQNAGKSTLINAFAKKEGIKVTKLTEAAVPGTTLGILRIGGILSAKAKMYDTPGLLHPYLTSMRLLNREEPLLLSNFDTIFYNCRASFIVMAKMAAEPITVRAASSSAYSFGLRHRHRHRVSKIRASQDNFYKQLGMFSLRKKIEDSILSAEILAPTALEFEEARHIKQEEEVRECNLWDDVTKSNEILVNLAESAKVVDGLKDLKYKAEEAKLIMELAEMDAINDVLFKQAYAASIDVNKLLKKYEISKILKEPYDKEGASLTIESGCGGMYDEIWAERLARMYIKWAEKQGHKWRIVEKCPSSKGGMKSVTIELESKFVYGYLMGERGIHRMIRSVQDGSTLFEASLAAVDVIPLFLEAAPDLSIDDKDLVISFPSCEEEQSSRTVPAVHVQHIPTGLTLQSTGERSHFANKMKALNRLKAKLLTILMNQGTSTLSSINRSAIVDIRNQETRRYVFYPSKLVQDVKTGVQVPDLNAVLNGNIEPLINAHISMRREYDAI